MNHFAQICSALIALSIWHSARFGGMSGGIYADDGVGRSDLGAEIQVSVNVRGGGNITVSQPLLDLLQADTVGVQQAGAAMAGIGEKKFFFDVIFFDNRENLGGIRRA